MDSKNLFFDIILNQYTKVSIGEIPNDLLNGLCESIADYYYDQYHRFGNQYPKSIKRYSSFQIKDLDHPTTFELVIKYFKNQLKDKYSIYSQIILQMTEEELKTFEKSREDFYKMF